MSQRDYEQQPEAPDLASVLQQDTAESLTGPAGEVDPLDAGYAPPDRPYALDDDQVTVEGQREGETLDERLAAEIPEEVPEDVNRAGRLADAESGGDDTVAEDVGVDGGAASAEEAAVHVVDLGSQAATDDDEGVADEVAAETLAADPDVDTARVDAVRDMRATDEGSAAPDDRV